MFSRGFIALGLIAFSISGCTKSPEDLAKLTKASVVLITAYTAKPSTGTGFIY